MKGQKRFLFWMLWMALLLCICAGAQAETRRTADGLEYAVYADHVRITGYTGMAEVLYIPAEIEGLPVVEVTMAHHDGNWWVTNDKTQKVVLPETVEVLGDSCFYNYVALREIEGLEHVRKLCGDCFNETRVTELVFSEKLDSITAFSFGSCPELRRLCIPDDVKAECSFEHSNIQRYTYSLETIELIATGNEPTFVLDGLALYTSDMKTLVAYPSGMTSVRSYWIPEGVEAMAPFAFSLRGGYETNGLQDIVIPRSMQRVDYNTFFSPDAGEFVMPYMHIYSDSPLAGYAQSMGYMYRLRDQGTVTVHDRVREIVAEATTEDMSDYEKAFALNRWLTENVVYDQALKNHTAFYMLMYGTGVCQSYMLTYEMLLDEVGIPNYQVIVWVVTDEADDGHGFNAVYLNGEWCYVDTTWNQPGYNVYFGMNADMVTESYTITDFDSRAQGNNMGYVNYYYYQQGVYTESFQEASQHLQARIAQGESKIVFTLEDIAALLAPYPETAETNTYMNMALLAAYWRDFAFDCDETVYVKYDTFTDEIIVSIGLELSDYSVSMYGDGVCIEGYSGSETEINIPSEINGLPVVKIGNNLFYENMAITTVMLPETVEEIGVNAFYRCGALVRITLPESLKKIDYNAFVDCKALQAIDLPQGLEYLGSSALYGCDGLKKVVLPESLQYIGGAVFYACKSLEEVQLPSHMTVIPANMFGSCVSLKDIQIPAGVTRIESGAFTNCTFAEIVLPGALEYIDEYAFLNSGIQQVELPASVKEIGPSAFYATALRSVELNEGLETIGETAFYNAKLESVWLPASLKSLGERCFEENADLSEVKVDADNPYYVEDKGILYTKDMRKLILSPAGVSGVVRVPASVREIGPGAFVKNKKVTQIVFEGSVEKIGEQAFADCVELKEITVPAGLEALPAYCFLRCSSLEKVNLPDTLISIGAFAFEQCSSLRSLALPDSVESLGENFVAMCPVTSLRIPKGVTSLADNLLSSCRIDSLYVHPGVAYIGLNNLAGEGEKKVCGFPLSCAQTYAEQNGFQFVVDLELQALLDTLALPAMTDAIDAEAFCETSAELVLVPAGCRAIGERAFYRSERLMYACLPASVEAIGQDAFDNGVVLMVQEGSYAQRWAAEQGMRIYVQP